MEEEEELEGEKKRGLRRERGSEGRRKCKSKKEIKKRI